MVKTVRLIDADKLADYICDACGSKECDRKPYAHCVERDFAVRVANDAPTIDAVPVKHGEWVVVMTEELCDFDECKCSVCGVVEYFIQGWKKFSYCPNCGAKMDDE